MRDKQIDRQTDRDRETQTQRERQRETERQRERERRETHWESKKERKHVCSVFLTSHLTVETPGSVAGDEDEEEEETRKAGIRYLHQAR